MATRIVLEITDETEGLDVQALLDEMASHDRLYLESGNVGRHGRYSASLLVKVKMIEHG